MAIDTRSGMRAGGADDAPERRSGATGLPGDAAGGTNTSGERLVPATAGATPDGGGRADRGDDSRFEAEALPFIDDVYRFAVSLTRDAADADDIVQETYLRAYRSWHTFQPGSDARRWLFTIARNVFLRSRERERRQVDVADADLEALQTFATHGQHVRDGTDRLLSRIDLGPALRRALAELDEPFKSAVVIVDLEDQSYEDAANILGVPIGTVRSRLFRGRRILQDKLVEYARDAGFTTAERGNRGTKE